MEPWIKKTSSMFPSILVKIYDLNLNKILNYKPEFNELIACN